MMSDSPPMALSLAQAMKAWPAPHLVTAVQAAEAPFSPEELDRLQREWLRDLVEARHQRRDARPYAASEHIRALHLAWQELSSDFGNKVRLGNVVLWGRMQKPLERRDAEPLPASWGGDLLYFPLRETVIFHEDAYREVTAEQGFSAESCKERLRSARLARGEIALVEAFREWANPTLLSEVCRCERQMTPYDIAQITAYTLLSDRADLAQPSGRSWIVGPTDYTELLSAGRALEDDFRRRLVDGEFHLRGVMAEPRRKQTAETLPGAWSADFRFDFQRNVVSIDDARYVAVIAVWGQASMDNGGDDAGIAAPTAAVNSEERAEAPMVLRPFTADNVRDLSDDEVLLLLEDYARRVAEEEGSELKMPVKVSFMPIIRRKMEHRSQVGELAQTLKVEANFLESWIKTKASSHQTPGAEAIMNNLRSTYWALKP